MTRFAGRLAYVATPHYCLPGCLGPRYLSLILVREEAPAHCLYELKGARVAVNSRDSQSGYNCLRHSVAPMACGKPFFSGVLVTGSHADSAMAVGAGRADVAAVDCVTHGLLARYRPECLAGTRVLGHTASAPALPYVTRAGMPAETLEALRLALFQVAAAPALAPVTEALGLCGFTVLPAGAYEEILTMEQSAQRLGYPQLH